MVSARSKSWKEMVAVTQKFHVLIIDKDLILCISCMLDRVRADMEERHRQQVEALQARNSSLEAEAQQLREAKFGLEARSSELGHRLAAVEGTLAALETEAERLRAAAAAAGSEKGLWEAELSELRAKLRTAEERV